MTTKPGRRSTRCCVRAFVAIRATGRRRPCCDARLSLLHARRFRNGTKTTHDVNLGAFVRGADDASAARDAEARAFCQHYARLRDAARRAKAFCVAAASQRASPETQKSGAEALERALALLAGLYRKPQLFDLRVGETRARWREHRARHRGRRV
jgi:hypothetical protein